MSDRGNTETNGAIIAWVKAWYQVNTSGQGSKFVSQEEWPQNVIDAAMLASEAVRKYFDGRDHDSRGRTSCFQFNTYAPDGGMMTCMATLISGQALLFAFPSGYRSDGRGGYVARHWPSDDSARFFEWDYMNTLPQPKPPSLEDYEP